ncbi:UNVERIFIED_CONTAM: hypothetical protein Sradi_4994400 [Sesamum radiatum]|uniref:PGG domain-containing protein n=1 Tax=Sesamum radiatum TaxID=300843 RepID=A0AAW2MF15_SESRA
MNNTFHNHQADEMSHFDLRFAILMMINILKSQTAKPWEWDPFDVASELTWIKLSLLAIFLLIFSFISIGVPLTTVPPNNMRYIQVQMKSFSASLLAGFLASLFFPQLLFWYVCPMIPLFFLCYAAISNVSRSFIYWAQATLSLAPDFNIWIATTNRVEAAIRELHDEDGEANVEEGRAPV